jgi:hypothetical protein
VFPVEICVADENLAAIMAAMREWLDHRRFEPTTFRYTFSPRGLVVRVDFSAEAEASAFATEFAGRVVDDFDDAAPQTAA